MTIVALLGALSTPAAAHGGAILTIHSDGTGAVWVTAQFQDGHPITAGFAAVMTATAQQTPTPQAGARVGPVALRPSADRPGALAPDGRLPPGTWYVEVDMASPGIGRCVATVPAAAPAPAAPTEVRCGGSPPPAAKPPASPPASPPTALYLILAGMAVIVVTLAVALYRTRRR